MHAAGARSLPDDIEALADYVIGVIELSTAAALILGAFQPIFSTLRAAMSAATYLITLTFFLSIPGVAEATAGGIRIRPVAQRSEVMSEQMARIPGPALRR